jgi:hypothetical protein
LVLAAAGAVAWIAAAMPAPSLAKSKVAEVPTRLSEFFGKDSVALIQSGGAVEIARLRKNPMGEDFVVERVDRIGGPTAKAFRDLFLNPSTYSLPAMGESDAKLCPQFAPGAVVRFQGARGKLVDVLLSFSCNEAGMTTDAKLPKKLQKGKGYAGWPKSRADMSPGGIRMLELVLRVYPKDADLKAFLAAQKGE